MTQLVPKSIRSLVEQLSTEVGRWSSTNYRIGLTTPVVVVRRATNKMWVRYRAFLRIRHHQGAFRLDEKGRRILDGMAMPARGDEQAMHEYYRMVILPGEEEFIRALQILLRACMIECMPWASKQLSIDQQNWEDAIHYVVDYRLLFYEAGMYAFGPTRVHNIKSNELFLQRLGDFAKNLRNDRRNVLSLNYQDGDAEQQEFDVPDPSERGQHALEDAEFIEQMTAYVRDNPPGGMSAEIVVHVLDGIKEGGKKMTALAKWLTLKTGQRWSETRARSSYRKITEVCRYYALQQRLNPVET